MRKRKQEEIGNPHSTIPGRINKRIDDVSGSAPYSRRPHTKSARCFFNDAVTLVSNTTQIVVDFPRCLDFEVIAIQRTDQQSRTIFMHSGIPLRIQQMQGSFGFSGPNVSGNLVPVSADNRDS